jgi:hypothetical protein
MPDKTINSSKYADPKKDSTSGLFTGTKKSTGLLDTTGVAPNMRKGTRTSKSSSRLSKFAPNWGGKRKTYKKSRRSRSSMKSWFSGLFK